VTIDGIDIRTVKQSSLRAQIGVVLQDSLLFDDSVYANIAYGRPGASRQEVERVARAAQADPFVRRLPEGYDTPVGERGSKLSAGERQRVAIARALLKDPAVMILDEATSALDAESEELVNEAVEALTAGRTTFIIAHRLTTVVNADRVVVLKGGRIIEQGRHDDLAMAGGLLRLPGRAPDPRAAPDAPDRPAHRDRKAGEEDFRKRVRRA
jgi:ATP-binding cassette subfamily B protein